MWGKQADLTDLLHRGGEILRERGVTSLFHQTIEFTLRNLYFSYASNPNRIFRHSLHDLLDEESIQLCYNKQISNNYNPSKKNILIATESPAVVNHDGWLDDDMEFTAEISFGNFYNLEHYHCPYSLYAGRDSFVTLMENDPTLSSKSHNISIIYSDKTTLPGHELRHRVGEKFGDQIDQYGGGADNYIEDKADSLVPYRYQVVIENGKYPRYVSEKFYDAIKTSTIPIYWGGEKAIKQMGFDTDGILFFDDVADLRHIIDERVSKKEYEQLASSIRYNREHLISLRNQMKYDLFLNQVRPGFLTQQDGDDITHHFELE